MISVIAPSECSSFSRWPDYVDVKNPADGSLGMPDFETVKEIRRQVGTGAGLSVAIGDAHDDAEFFAHRAVRAAEAGADIVKVGLFSFSGEAAAGRFLGRINEASRQKPFRLVAALYADVAEEPFLRAFPAIAQRAGAWGCLIDTYKKGGGRLADYLGAEQLSRFTADCRSRGLASALAGGLAADDLLWLDEVQPDIAGFRSAVVASGRGDAGIDRGKLESLMSRAAALR